LSAGPAELVQHGPGALAELQGVYRARRALVPGSVRAAPAQALAAPAPGAFAPVRVGAAQGLAASEAQVLGASRSASACASAPTAPWGPGFRAALWERALRPKARACLDWIHATPATKRSPQRGSATRVQTRP